MSKHERLGRGVSRLHGTGKLQPWGTYESYAITIPKKIAVSCLEQMFQAEQVPEGILLRRVDEVPPAYTASKRKPGERLASGPHFAQELESEAFLRMLGELNNGNEAEQ